ncbi:hypothetical protein GGR53DRAFT_343416 [Hypoxylon sp. FL1150]|nr:hypothetical protein GGR53DRAFT_343416 [Hypoxylon sp. FL1150]
MGQSLFKATGASPRSHTILPLMNLISWSWYGPSNLPVVRVVVEKKGRLYLVPVSITAMDSVQTVMEKVRATRDEVFRQGHAFELLSKTFWSQRVTVATLVTFRHIGFLGHRVPLEVNVRDREACIDLDRPDLTDNTEPFIALYPELLEGNTAHKCVLIERKLKEHNVLMCAVVGIIIAIVAGMLVGVFSSNIGYGIGTSAGIIGAIGFLVTLATWVIERTETE